MVDLDAYIEGLVLCAGVDIRKGKSKVAFGKDGAVLYHDDPVGLLKLKVQ